MPRRIDVFSNRVGWHRVRRLERILFIALLAGCDLETIPGPPGPRQAPSPLLVEAPPAVESQPAAGPTPPAPAPTSAPASGLAMVTLNTVVITNSGTTTTSGYRILVTQAGQATYTTPSGSGTRTLPVLLTQGLWGDLAAAGPLSSLAAGPCAPSETRATLRVSLGGQQTPDLSCPGGQLGQAIAEDVQKIVEYLGITVGPLAPGQPSVPVMTY